MVGAVLVEEEGGLELILGADNITLLDIESGLGEVVHDVVRVVVATIPISNTVNTEETSVVVVGVEGHEGVSKTLGSDTLDEVTARVLANSAVLVPTTEHGLENHQGNRIGVSPGRTLEGDGDSALSGIGVTIVNIRTSVKGGLLRNERANSGAVVLIGDGAEGRLSELDKGIVVDGTGSGEDHAGAPVVSLNVLNEVITGDAANVLLRTKDGTTKRGVLESSSMEVVKDLLVGLLVNLLHFPEDDAALTVDGLLIKLGVQKNVGEDIDSVRDILAHNLGIVAGLLTASVSIELTTHVLNLDLKVTNSALLGTLEEKVLKEVSGTIVSIILKPASRVNPNTNGGGLSKRDVLSGNPQTVGKSGNLGLRKSSQESAVVDGGREGVSITEERVSARSSNGMAGKGASSKTANILLLAHQRGKRLHFCYSRFLPDILIILTNKPNETVIAFSNQL
mmetsp:Transcript_29054/g.53396  ORF Transcript_29054/g.53396 Transcript_29054/m.53396 type:complete len:452 (-) Transcript_29054:12-1367(-)